MWIYQILELVSSSPTVEEDRRYILHAKPKISIPKFHDDNQVLSSRREVPNYQVKNWHQAVDHLVPGFNERIDLFKIFFSAQVFYFEKLQLPPVSQFRTWLSHIYQWIRKQTLVKMTHKTNVTGELLWKRRNIPQWDPSRIIESQQKERCF